MSNHLAFKNVTRPASLVPLALVLATLVLTTRALPSAQAPLWQVKDVAALDLGPANCLRTPRVIGFDFAPDGTPIVGWTQVEGCGGNNWTAWAEERDGAWQGHVFPTPAQGTFGSHEMGLGGDGQPYMFLQRHMNSYYDVAVADLRAIAAGAPGVIATGEGLGPSCLYSGFRVATVAGQTLPSRTTQLSFCSGSGPLRIDGANLLDNVTNRGHDFAVGPTGQAHIAFVDGGGRVYYLRPDQPPVLVANVNRFSDDIAIAQGGDGVIHLVVRGFESTADYDRGRLGYLRSIDNGLTWTFVDYVDALKPQWGLSLQVDADGQPAVAYWYYNQLTYATRASGAWVKSLVAEPIWQNTEWLKQPRLRFDSFGTPHIAYYDWTANRIRVAAPEFYQPPTITNPGDQSSVEGDTVSLPIDGAVGDGKLRTFMATGLPPGLSIDPATGVISGTLSPGSAGTRTVTVTISDAVTDVSVQFNWTVAAPPPPPSRPTLVLPGGQSYTAVAYGVELTYEILATTTNAGATLLPIDASALPTGATLTVIAEAVPPASRTYRFAWTPQPEFHANGTPVTSRTVCYSVRDTAGMTMLGNNCATVTLPPIPDRFAHGTLSWTRDLSHVSATTHKIRITFDGSYRRSFAWPTGTPQVGTVLPGLVKLDLAGAGYLDTVTPDFAVQSVNAADDFITGMAVVDVEIPIAAGAVTAVYQDCCRLATVLDGNANTSFKLSTTISASATRSPLVTVVPRVYASVDQPLAFQLPATAYDGLTNRFAVSTPTDSGLITPHPGAAPFISNGGFVSWTPATEGLHAVQFTVTSVDSRGEPKVMTTAEMIVDVRPPCSECLPVTVTAPPTVTSPVGVESRTVVTATASLPSRIPELDYTALAIGMQLHQLTTGQTSSWELVWTPEAGQPSTFVCFQARDGEIVSPVACSTFEIVEDPNQAPTAAGDHLSTNEDQAITVDAATLLANDSDPDGDALTVTEVGNPVNGAVVLSDGRVVFTPAPNAHGTGSFTYTIDDGRLEQATATVTVELVSVNDVPRIVGTLPDLTLLEDAATSISTVVGLTNDVDGDAITYSVSSSDPSVATVTVDNTSRALFITPVPNASGSATVTVVASDAALSDQATFVVTVRPVNDAPAFAAVAGATVQSGSAAVINVGGLNPGPASEAGQQLTLTATSSDAAVTGPIVVTGAGPTRELRFTPPARPTHGQVTLMLSLTDDGGTADGGQDRTSQAVAVTVLPVANRPPTIDPIATQTWAVNGWASVGVGATDPDSDNLIFEAEGLPPGVVITSPGSYGLVAEIAGVPQRAGSGQATVRARDSRGATAEVSFDWQVTGGVPDLAVAINAPAVMESEQGQLAITVANAGSGVAQQFAVDLQKSSNLSFTATDSRCSLVLIFWRCTSANLAPGSSEQFTFAFRRSDGLAATLIGRLRSATPGDGNAANDTAVHTIAAESRSLDLAVTMSAPATVRPGETFPVTVRVQNNSPQWSTTNGRLLLSVSQGELIAAPGCVSLANPICDFVLPPGGVREYELTFQANRPRDRRPRTASITAEVMQTHSDPVPANNRAQAAVRIEGAPMTADLALTLAAPAFATVPADPAATVSVRNLGPDDVDGFRVTIRLTGPGSTYPSLPAGHPCTAGPAGPITCAGPALAANGAPWTVNVPLPVRSAGRLNIDAEVSAGRIGGVTVADPVSNNNGAAESLRARLPNADLEIASAAALASIQAGGTATYQVSIRNNGPEPAGGVVLRPHDGLVNAAEWIASPTCVLTPVTFDGALGEIVIGHRMACPVAGLLAPGETRVVSFGRRPVAGEAVIRVPLRLEGDVADANLANNRREVTTLVQQPPPPPVPTDLEVTLRTPERSTPNRAVDMEVDVRNLRTVAATRVMLRLLVSNGALDGSNVVYRDGPRLVTAPCLPIAGGRECDLGDMAPQSTRRLTFEATPSVAFGVMGIEATVATTSLELVTGNNRAVESVEVFVRRPRADLRVTGAATSGEGTVDAVFQVTNLGPADASVVRLTVSAWYESSGGLIPSTLSWVAPSGCSQISGGSPSGGQSPLEQNRVTKRFSCTISLVAGQTIPLTFRATSSGYAAVDGGASMSVSDIQYLGVDLIDPVTGNNGTRLNVSVW